MLAFFLLFIGLAQADPFCKSRGLATLLRSERPKVYDTLIFNHEADLLEIRFYETAAYVDDVRQWNGCWANVYALREQHAFGNVVTYLTVHVRFASHFIQKLVLLRFVAAPGRRVPAVDSILSANEHGIQALQLCDSPLPSFKNDILRTTVSKAIAVEAQLFPPIPVYRLAKRKELVASRRVRFPSGVDHVRM